MYLLHQEFGERIVHQAVTLHQSPAGKARGDDQQAKMPFPAATRVSGVGCAIVPYFQT